MARILLAGRCAYPRISGIYANLWRHQSVGNNLWRSVLSGVALVAIAGACVFGQATAAPAQSDTNATTLSELPLVAPSNTPPAATFWLWSMYHEFGPGDFGMPIPWNPWGSNV